MKEICENGSPEPFDKLAAVPDGSGQAVSKLAIIIAALILRPGGPALYSRGFRFAPPPVIDCEEESPERATQRNP
jgi:hypothetical protein